MTGSDLQIRTGQCQARHQVRQTAFELWFIGTVTLKAVQQSRSQFRMTLEGAQHIQTHDIARSFPDGIDGCLTVKPGHGRIFYIAIPAPDLHALAQRLYCSLAYPELCRRRQNAAVGLLEFRSEEHTSELQSREN